MPITVNGVEITDAAIYAEMQHHPAPSREAAEYSAKLALVAKELLLQEAARLGIAGIDEDARIAALIEREVKTPEPDEEHCRRFFQANRQRFRGGDLFEASHILCAASPDDAGVRAAALSDCPSRQTGGNLGQIGPGQTVPEFERALAGMREGETSSQPVASRFGFHVIQLRRKIEGRPLEYGMVRDRIAGYLRENVQRRAISQYLSLLIGRADIGGIDLMGADSPLVR